jgi:hypothetical protein
MSRTRDRTRPSLAPAESESTTKGSRRRLAADSEPHPPLHRCPTGRESSEIRVFILPGRMPELVIQTFRRISPEMGPWGPTGDIPRIQLPYAEALIEAIRAAATSGAGSGATR